MKYPIFSAVDNAGLKVVPCWIKGDIDKIFEHRKH